MTDAIGLQGPPTTEKPPSVLAANLRKPRSLWGDTFRAYRRHRLAMIGTIVFLGLVLAVTIGPMLRPMNLSEVGNFANAFQSPSLDHPFGTDPLGRDLLAMLLYGGRVSIAVGVAAMLVAVLVGTIIGSVSGFFGGRTDNLLVWVTDLFLALPTLPVLLLVIYLFRDPLRAVFGINVGIFMLTVFVIGLLTWMGVSRLVRASFMSLKQKEFVEAAHSVGTRTGGVMFKRILPNSMSPIIVAATLAVGAAIQGGVLQGEVKDVLLVDDGHGQQVVLVDQHGDGRLVGVGGHLHDAPVHHLVQRRSRPREEELAQRNDADQAARLVGQVEVENHFDVFAIANILDRFLNRQRVRQRKEVGGHDAAGAVRVVLEQALDFVLAFPVEQRHQLRTLFLWQVADQVSEVIRRQMLQDSSKFLDRRLGHHLRAQADRQLAEHFGRHFGLADRVEDVNHMLRRQLVENRRQVGWMQAGDHLLQRCLGIPMVEAVDGFDQPFFLVVVRG